MNPIATLFLFPFQPRRVARAHAQTPLWKVYVIHWLGLVTLAGTVVALVPVWNAIEIFLPNPNTTIRRSVNPVGTLLIVLAVGETIFLLVASSMTCWAGRDEPIAASWRHALRMSWLYVGHLVWLTVTIVVTIAAGMRSGPTIVRGTLFLLFVSALIVASIVSYLRALTAPRTPTPAPGSADPTCEWCGYILAHLDAAGECPECGKPIAESLDASRRTPLVDRRGRRGDRCPSLTLAAWFRPERLFQSINAHTLSPVPVALLARTLAATAFLSGGASVLTVLFNVTPPPLEDVMILYMVMFVIGMCTAWVCFMLASAIASFVGFWGGTRGGRNGLMAALQAVMLTGGFFALWAPLAAAWLLQTRFNLGGPTATVVFLLVNVLIGCGYVAAVFKRFAYLRYANR